jgi:hypothetical protein
VVVLIAHPAVPIPSRLLFAPISFTMSHVLSPGHIFPKLGGFAQRGHHDIDLAVVVEIGAIIAP